MNHRSRTFLIRALRSGLRPHMLLLVVGLVCAPALAQGQPGVPENTEGIGIFEQLDAQLPLDLPFTAEDGSTVTLGEYFDGERPVLLTLVYYTCPGICNALLNGLTSTLEDMEWTAGEEFRIVTVSIDPTESNELAGSKKRSYLSFYDRPSAKEGWRFLVGEQENIVKLAETVGFAYRYQKGTGLYTHAATVIVCTPTGRVSRYINEVIFEPETLRMALTEAGEGRIGTPVQRFILKWCYSYDATAGKYVIAARKIMAYSGALIVLLTFFGLVVLWRRDLRMRSATAGASKAAAVAEPHS